MKRNPMLMAILFAALLAAGCAPLPVLTVDHQQVMRVDGKPLTMDDMERVVRVAAYEEDWDLQPESPGYVVATKRSDNDWKLTVEIVYTANDFSIRYKDSTGLQYDPMRGTIAKHGRGVMEDLRDRIKDEVQLLSLRGN